MERTIDYNTERKQLLQPEYGRSIQQMIDHAMTIEDRAERQRCANTIFRLMLGMQSSTIKSDDLAQKVWNHLAAMAKYQLDIDYPVEIERHDSETENRENIPYPQKRISKRHYGALLEELTRKLADIEDEDERNALVQLAANQMKRSLAGWNRDIMDDDKIMDDLVEYAGDSVAIERERITLISDIEALTTAVQTVKKKKKK